ARGDERHVRLALGDGLAAGGRLQDAWLHLGLDVAEVAHLEGDTVAVVVKDLQGSPGRYPDDRVASVVLRGDEAPAAEREPARDGGAGADQRSAGDASVAIRRHVVPPQV